MDQHDKRPPADPAGTDAAGTSADHTLSDSLSSLARTLDEVLAGLGENPRRSRAKSPPTPPEGEPT